MKQSQLDFEPIGKWEWQSNVDAWSSEELQWKPYQPSESILLEKGYWEKQKEVDLGKYIVSLKDMLQTNKNNKVKQRRVRRIEQNCNQIEEIKINKIEILRKDRFFGAENPKT